jgi:hypothetical protein
MHPARVRCPSDKEIDMNKTSWKVALAARQRLGHCRRAARGSVGQEVRCASHGDGDAATAYAVLALTR